MVGNTLSVLHVYARVFFYLREFGGLHVLGLYSGLTRQWVERWNPTPAIPLPLHLPGLYSSPVLPRGRDQYHLLFGGRMKRFGLVAQSNSLPSRPRSRTVGFTSLQIAWREHINVRMFVQVKACIC